MGVKYIPSAIWNILEVTEEKIGIEVYHLLYFIDDKFSDIILTIN